MLRTLSLRAAIIALLVPCAYPAPLHQTIEGLDRVRPVGGLSAYDWNGWQTEADGNRLAVRSVSDSFGGTGLGSVSIFEYQPSGQYTFVQKIVEPGSVSIQSPRLGESMLMSRDFLFLSADRFLSSANACSGALFIYHWNGSRYEPFQTLTSASGGTFCGFGGYMDFDGEFLFTSSSIDNEFGFNHGSIERYRLGPAGFQREYRFVDTTLSFLGSGLRLTGDGRLLAGSGNSVTLLSGVYGASWQVESQFYGQGVFAEEMEVWGDEVLVSSPRLDTAPFQRKGQVAIFDLLPVGMAFREFLEAPGGTVGPVVGDDFGGTLTIQGDRLYVGARLAWDPNQAMERGAAYVFKRSAGSWVPEYTLRPGGTCCDEANFGRSLSVDGSKVVAGAPFEQRNGLIQVGSTYVFEVPFGTEVCQASNFNSIATQPMLRAYGSASAQARDLHFRAMGVPGSGIAMLLASDRPRDPRPVVASQGLLCLGGAVTRLSVGSVAQSVATFSVDWGNSSTGAGLTVQSGTPLYYQAWYRDSNPHPTSNLTSAVEVMLE